MKILIDTDELVEFFGEEWCSCDISTKEELKSFLVDFCKQKIEGKEEKEEPVKSEICPKIDSITYLTRDQAQKHLQLLRDEHTAYGSVTIRDYYRLAEWLQIIPKWTHLHFRADYGWKDLSTVRINSIHHGGIDLWTLEMPELKKLDVRKEKTK